MMDCPETCRKPPRQVSGFLKKNHTNKKFGNQPETNRKLAENLPETCHGGFRQVSGGFLIIHHWRCGPHGRCLSQNWGLNGHFEVCLDLKRIKWYDIFWLNYFFSCLIMRKRVFTPLNKISSHIFKIANTEMKYRGSPDSTVSLSTVPGLVWFSNSTK